MKITANTLGKSFKSHIEGEILYTSRIMCLLGALLYASFIIADLYSTSVALSDIILIRGTVVVTLVTGYFVTFNKIFLKYYDQLVFLILLVATVGIEVMIYLAAPEEHSSKVYFVGLMLVIMTVFSWTFFKNLTSLIFVTSIIGSYAALGFSKGLATSDLLVNISLLLSATAIGFISQIIRNRHLRENYLLGQSLERAYKEKKEEAKGHAHLANHDGLTGLPNRRYLMELLEGSLNVAKQKDKALVIFFLDLNGFKQVNDTYGHAFGDEVLRTVAQRITDIIPVESYLSRLGGDEFIVSLMLDKYSIDEINLFIKVIIDTISLPMIMQGEKIRVGTSIGVSTYPKDADTIDELIVIADDKMYQDKSLQKTNRARKVG